MSPDELARCWVPVPMRWRHVQRGEVMVGSKELLRVIHCAPGDAGRWMVTVGAMVAGPDALWAGPVDPDELVSVLVQVPERDARSLALEELAATVIGRRTTEGMAS